MTDYMEILRTGLAFYGVFKAGTEIWKKGVVFVSEDRRHELTAHLVAQREFEDKADKDVTTAETERPDGTTAFMIHMNKATRHKAERVHMRTEHFYVDASMFVLLLVTLITIPASLQAPGHPMTFILTLIVVFGWILVFIHIGIVWAWRRAAAPHQHTWSIVRQKGWNLANPAVRSHLRNLAPPPLENPVIFEHEGRTYQLDSSKVAFPRLMHWYTRGLLLATQRKTALAVIAAVLLPLVVIIVAWACVLLGWVSWVYATLFIVFMPLAWVVGGAWLLRPGVTHYSLTDDCNEIVATAALAQGTAEWKAEGLAARDRGTGVGFAMLQVLLDHPDGPGRAAAAIDLPIKLRASTEALAARYREKWPALRAVDGKARTYIYPPDAPRGSPDDAGTR